MPIYYKVYQSNRKGSKFKGKWYGRAAIIGTVDDDELAARIEEKCTVHKADVKAVITALVGEISGINASAQTEGATDLIIEDIAQRWYEKRKPKRDFLISVLRKVRDSNPRYHETGIPDFESSAFGHSANLPKDYLLMVFLLLRLQR